MGTGPDGRGGDASAHGGIPADSVNTTAGRAGLAPGAGTAPAGTGACSAIASRKAVYFGVGSPASSRGASSSEGGRDT
ncbi:hypothetical protein SNE510_35860 [Streptomyces sp. NE5-10]|nr:hypothetical protein SNE510_35860 [Streptomyces sp. NE5-10]